MIYKDKAFLWLESIKTQVKTKTVETYTNALHNHIIPHFGDCEIGDVSRKDVCAFLNAQAESGNSRTGKGLSKSSMNCIFTVLKNTLHSDAFFEVSRKDYLKKCSFVPHRVRIECFDIVEQKRIERCALEGKLVKTLGVLICLYTGIRIGELMALTWKDIDLGKCEIQITKSFHNGKNKDGIYGNITESPKSNSSNRIIPIPKSIVPLIEKVKKLSRCEYVVSNGSRRLSVRAYQSMFSDMLIKAGVKHRGFHSIRHTFATRALEVGMDFKTLSEILGHTSPVVTMNVYAHSLSEHKRKKMDEIGAVFEQ